MKKAIIILTAFVVLLTGCDISSAESKELQSREINSITVVDVNTGDTIRIEFSGNPGVSDKAYKLK